tara:strand:- start:499 stop:771 length:273 start_codon:yes stop_codon:yes gene_type:complete
MGLKKIIQDLPLDKKEHIVVGVVYSVLIPILGLFFGGIGSFIGFMIGTFLNAWKEVWNDGYRGKGNPEVEDFIATEIPLIIAYFSFYCSL